MSVTEKTTCWTPKLSQLKVAKYDLLLLAVDPDLLLDRSSDLYDNVKSSTIW